ncbi:hypothetical protein QCE73_01925 [Caballeronia sp. LZ029]|uniref:hypothetical protein n=1 Tax=Caballeronia sp. LZ029 TaxID=3038564 RepID=UPI0028605399|nr:hypothetical protein [Caballeronia sp. LZ029]MDR5741909.1 hypothetical protein [Caballeronia sp. LZ029]
MRIRLFEFVLFTSLASGMVHAEEFFSPNHQVKINIDCDRDGFNCKASYQTGTKAGALDVVGSNLGIKWYGNTAAVIFSCGSVCSGAQLVDETGVIGNYSDLLSFDESNKCVAYMQDWNIIRFDIAGKKIRDVDVKTFKPRPMRTATFMTLVEAAKFEKGDFFIGYRDERQEAQRIVIKNACSDK